MGLHDEKKKTDEKIANKTIKLYRVQVIWEAMLCNLHKNPESKGSLVVRCPFAASILSFSHSLGKENNFNKFSQSDIQHLGEPYDYGSIMHYGPKAFSKNGLATIVALKHGGNQMGQRTALSANDIRQINQLYKCPQSE